jgi:hypothetical protein
VRPPPALLVLAPLGRRVGLGRSRDWRLETAVMVTPAPSWEGVFRGVGVPVSPRWRPAESLGLGRVV